jgi:biopolymer transport protein ExbB
MKKSYLKPAVLLMMLVVVGGFAATAGAQEAVEAGAEAVHKMTFGEMLKQGGWAMWPLGMFSSAMLFLIIRNFLLLRPRNLLRSDLTEELEAVVKCGDIAAAREICQNNPSLMTSVLDAGLERIDADDFDAAHVSEAIEEAGNEQMVTFMKTINFLSIIGGTAPMLGLLGTVSGMIKAFQTIAAGGMGKPELLAGNIGEALITTATGLIIAIPAMIAYFIFKNNFIKHMSTMGRMVSHLLSVYRNAHK